VKEECGFLARQLSHLIPGEEAELT
jgi:hypothetical protein